MTQTDPTIPTEPTIPSDPTQRAKKRSERPDINPLAALVFPFIRSEEVGRFALLPLLSFVPLVGVIYARGWRLDTVRHSVRSGVVSGAPVQRFGHQLVDGLLLWVLRTLFFVPLVVIVWFFAYELVEIVVDLLQLAAFHAGVPDVEEITFEDIRAKADAARLAGLLAPFAYTVVVWPVYRACIVRYAITGRATSLFNVPGGALLVLRHPVDFLVVFAYWLVMRWLIEVPVWTVLTLTGFGALLIPLFAVPVHYWSTAHVYATLALRVRKSVRR